MSNFKANKAVLSCSGGMDSSCLLLTLLAQGKEVRCYSFDYGQKHRIELEKIKKNIEFLQSKGLPVSHQVINLEDVFSDSASSLHVGGSNIPHDAYNSENQKSTVIENRNIVFSACIYTKALSWANKTNENVLISLGIHKNDFSTYPDCRPESQEMARELYRISNWGSERVDYIAPFVNMNKAEVLGAGLDAARVLEFTEDDIKEFLSNTHSCYDVDKDGNSCGLCGTCQERIWAFYMNGIEDPIPYKISKEKMLEIAKSFETN